jgi:flavin reductase (DIM6/NTAB) family NADH-FMN oxidoreductase RutF
MTSIDPNQLTPEKRQAYLQGAVAPRPIALASTMSKSGKPNLAPFSFFNIVSANPPILVFSPLLQANDKKKHTLTNCETTQEVVINSVTYNMVQQMSLSGSEYPEGINEFLKSGFTPIPSEKVKPYRVAESPVQFECKVNKIISLGKEAGAGNLILCEVVKIHLHEEILDQEGSIDPEKIDLVSRMGANWYSRAKTGLFEVVKPTTKLGIGLDAMPAFVKKSPVFTTNDLGKLGTINCLPTNEEIDIFVNRNFAVKGVLSSDDIQNIHLKAKEYLDKNDTVSAWKLLLAKGI